MQTKEVPCTAKLTKVTKQRRCDFCGSFKNDTLNYGPVYKLGNLKVHYFCVLLSNRLIQNGNDDEGILGFLQSDIQKELERTTKILCSYCMKGNATISCAARRCKKKFHLPCGLRRGTAHQFIHQFKSFCHRHFKLQYIPPKILKEAYRIEQVCCICQETLDMKYRRNIFLAPCCLNSWYHRNCLQKFAYNAGYFCRCPACNNDKKFNCWMQRYGIFIPQQDASWELVPNAFEELLFKYSNCDAKCCKCPFGREYNEEYTRWEIVLCMSCGSQGVHSGCSHVTLDDREWECPGCREVTDKMKSSGSGVSDSVEADDSSSNPLKLTEVGRKRRRRGSEGLENFVLDKRKKHKGNIDDEETEVDVETVDEEVKNRETLPEIGDKPRDVRESGSLKVDEVETPEVFSFLKPGPLSYKWAVIQNQKTPPGQKERNNKTEAKLSSTAGVFGAGTSAATPTKGTSPKAASKIEDSIITPTYVSPLIKLCPDAEPSPLDYKPWKTEPREEKELARSNNDTIVIVID